MTVPLVVLAALSIVGGRCSTFRGCITIPRRILDPTFGTSRPVGTRARSRSTGSGRRRRGRDHRAPRRLHDLARHLLLDEVRDSVPRTRLALGMTPTTPSLAVPASPRPRSSVTTSSSPGSSMGPSSRVAVSVRRVRGAAQGAVGLRASLRPGHGPRPRRRAGLSRSEGRVVMHSSIWLTLLIVVPIAGALVRP